MKERDIRGRTSDWPRMTEEDDVMSSHIVQSVGGSEFGTGQSHIVYPQHVLYELFGLGASEGETTRFLHVNGRL